MCEAKSFELAERKTQVPVVVMQLDGRDKVAIRSDAHDTP